MNQDIGNLLTCQAQKISSIENERWMERNKPSEIDQIFLHHVQTYCLEELAG